MGTIPRSAVADEPEIELDELPALTFSEAHLYLTLLNLRMGVTSVAYPEVTRWRSDKKLQSKIAQMSAHGPRPRIPIGDNGAEALLFRENALRQKAGWKPIKSRRLRQLVSALRDKGYIEFRSCRGRRNRKPPDEDFRRGTYLAVIGPEWEAVRTCKLGKRAGDTNRPARIPPEVLPFKATR